jgi:hypothetical protein
MYKNEHQGKLNWWRESFSHTSGVGHERRFRPVRQMSAYLLTAAEKQTSANRRLGPIPLKKTGSNSM